MIILNLKDKSHIVAINLNLLQFNLNLFLKNFFLYRFCIAEIL